VAASHKRSLRPAPSMIRWSQKVNTQSISAPRYCGRKQSIKTAARRASSTILLSAAGGAYSWAAENGRCEAIVALRACAHALRWPLAASAHRRRDRRRRVPAPHSRPRSARSSKSCAPPLPDRAGTRQGVGTSSHLLRASWCRSRRAARGLPSWEPTKGRLFNRRSRPSMPARSAMNAPTLSARFMARSAAQTMTPAKPSTYTPAESKTSALLLARRSWSRVPAPWTGGSALLPPPRQPH
jgi:hypothetical protein